MKQLLLCGLLLPGLASAQTTPAAFTIKGSVGKLNAPAKVYLVRLLPVSPGVPMMRQELTDSATLVNGRFELKGQADLPTEAALYLQRDGRRRKVFAAPAEQVRVFLEPGPIVVTGIDSLTKAHVSGGQPTADYQSFVASMAGVTAQMAALSAAYQRASEAERNTPAFQQRGRQQGEQLMALRSKVIGDFITAHPASWASLYALQQIGPIMQYSDIGPYYTALSPALKQTPVGRQYGEMVQKLQAVSVGGQAPLFTQPTPEGKAVSLADYRGKYVLVDFWASNCGPCRAETPNLMRAYRQYKDRNFEVLGVSLDNAKDRTKWLKAIADDGATWTQVSELRGFESQAAKDYQVQAIPQNFLLDPQGKIVAVNLRGDALHTTLASLLK